MSEVSEHYAAKRGNQYFEGRFGDRTAFGRRFQAEYFRPFCAPDRILLDFGCGDGTLLRTLPAIKRLAVEVNPAAINAVEAENQKDGPAIELVETIETVADESVDVVMSNHSLEHVPHPLVILREFKRVLKPGGTVVIVTPFDDWRSAKDLTWRAGDSDNHLYTWSPLNLGNLMVESGLEVTSTSLQTFAWSPRIFWVHRLFGQRAFRLAGGLLSRFKNRREVLAVARNP